MDTLFDRLGGEEAIFAITDLMYEKIFYDPDLEDFFKKTSKEKQKERQMQYMTYITGGAKEWHGKSIS
jgi:hemoglobin